MVLLFGGLFPRNIFVISIFFLEARCRRLRGSQMYYRWRKSLCKGRDDPHTFKGPKEWRNPKRGGHALCLWRGRLFGLPKGGKHMWLLRLPAYAITVTVEHSKVVFPVICLLEVKCSAVHIIHQLPEIS